MPNVIDDLILKYSLVDDYSDKAKKIKQSADDLGKSLKDVKDAAGKVGDDLKDGFKKVFEVVTAVTVGFAALATESIKTYIEFDKGRRIIRGFSKDSEDFAVNMKLIREITEKGAFKFEDLRDASELILAFNLNLQRFLPLANEFGEAWGANTEKMQEFIELVGRVNAGDFGRPFGPMGFGRFGITRNELEGAGLKFDKNGQYKGTVQQALDGIEKLVHQKYDSIAKGFESSPIAKFTNAIDRVQMAMVQFGGALVQKVLPYLDKLTKFGNDILGSGVIPKIASAILGLFGISGKDFNETLYNLKQFILRLPETISRAKPYIQDLVNLVKDLAKHWKLVLYGFIALKAIGFLADIAKLAISIGTLTKSFISFARVLINLIGAIDLSGIGAAIGGTAAAGGIGAAGIVGLIGAPFIAAAAWLRKHTLGNYDENSPVYQALGQPAPMFKDMQKRAAERKAHQAAMASQAKQQHVDTTKKTQDKLGEIATNTKKIEQHTSRQLDLQKYMAGGGDYGFNPYTTTTAYRHKHPGTIKVDASKAASGLEAYVTALIQDGINQALSEGHLRIA